MYHSQAEPSQFLIETFLSGDSRFHQVDTRRGTTSQICLKYLDAFISDATPHHHSLLVSLSNQYIVALGFGRKEDCLFFFFLSSSSLSFLSPDIHTHAMAFAPLNENEIKYKRK